MGHLLSVGVLAVLVALQAAPVLRESAAGPADAPVVVTVFSDFACEPCGHVAVVLQEVLRERSDRIHIVFRHAPAEDGRSLDAHLAAIAAAQQDKFLDLHNILFANQERLSKADVRAMAAQLGLDIAAFDAALARVELSELIARDRADAEARGVTQLPFVLINDVPFSGPITLEGLVRAIDARF